MLLPVLKTFTITKGIDFDYRFQWLKGTPAGATPVDLNSYTGVLTITSWDGQTTLMTLRSGVLGSGIFFGGGLNTPSNGIIDITITAADTATVTWESARYSFVLTDITQSPPKNTQLLYGSFGVFGFVP